MARAPCYANNAAPLAHPLPVTPPHLGWATRALDAAAAARAGWVTGVTGATAASAGAHAGDGATLRGALGSWGYERPRAAACA